MIKIHPKSHSIQDENFRGMMGKRTTSGRSLVKDLQTPLPNATTVMELAV